MNKTKQIDDYYISKNEINWDKIIDDFTPYIKTIINNMSSNNLNEEDKEEILLDTFFVLWKNKDNILISLDSYITGITRNLVKEKFRKSNITYDISEFENVLSYSNVELFSDERNELTKIEKCFKNLNDLDLKIVNSFYYSSKSIKEIASELHISKTNVTTRLYRIRKKIKKLFFMEEKDGKQ